MTVLSNFWREIDRADPFAFDFRPMLRQIDDIFNAALTPEATALMPEATRGFSSNFEVEEADDHYLISFEIPGVAVEDLDIEVRDNVLTVTGERKCSRQAKGGANASPNSSRYGKFQRVLTLPDGVKAESMESQYKDGVLKILVPKPVEAKATKIKIGEGKSGFLKSLLGEKKDKEALESKQESVAIAN